MIDDTIEALRPTLNAIATEMTLELSEPQIDALLSYLAQLQRWNTTYNLTAVRAPEQMLAQHLADCLAMVMPLRRHLDGRSTARLLDVGSGGGLPGAVIAITNSIIDVTCVDTVGKKAAFVQQAAGALRLSNLHAQHARVEKMQPTAFDVVTSRAFASLADFTQLTLQHVAVNGVWLAMKGKQPADELAQLPTNVRVFHVEQIHVPRLEAERCLVWMRPVFSNAGLPII
jgi:16S rRNA (guanine527-N7)-methyltransferase